MNIAHELAILLQVLIIDLSLAADNAIVIGVAAAGLPQDQRRRAVWIGLGAATGLRILLALFAVQLLHVAGLAVAGGFLLLWVAWKMIRDLLPARRKASSAKTGVKTLHAAILQILLADLGMSLDNILAVAGAARDHYAVLALGLVFSVGLMGLAATATAKMLQRFPWINWVGILIVLYVAARMIWDGVKTVF